MPSCGGNGKECKLVPLVFQFGVVLCSLSYLLLLSLLLLSLTCSSLSSALLLLSFFFSPSFSSSPLSCPLLLSTCLLLYSTLPSSFSSLLSSLPSLFLAYSPSSLVSIFSLSISGFSISSLLLFSLSLILSPFSPAFPLYSSSIFFLCSSLALLLSSFLSLNSPLSSSIIDLLLHIRDENGLRCCLLEKTRSAVQQGPARESCGSDVRGRYNANNQGRPFQRNNARGNGVAGNVGGQNRGGMINPGQAKPIMCYNYNGLGHIARECPRPKRLQDSDYFKEKMLLMQAKRV
ncbi:integrase, catalytic region, zinc finger, CCHC-type containing protein [Tanacetum coccineum]|uniref:Integrase, catalytic region, zinc finger, CCHC-type containing protein n=1 Tax=Tanacetum coccineum TaxID=301880 RepID=A0ABQ4XH22_9ASTR